MSTRFLPFLVAAAAVAVISVALLWIFQRRLIYLPWSGTLPAAAEVGAEDVRLLTADGLDLAGWFFPPAPGVAGATITVMVFNGNAGDRSLRLPLAQAFTDEGWGTLLWDYRGYGGNAGAPSETGLHLDALAARRFLDSRPDVDPAGLVYFGESLGAAVAVGLAVEVPPAALVLRSPFTSMTDMARVHYPFLPVRALLRDRYPSAERMSALTCPLLVLAGDRDTIVPWTQSRDLAAAAAPAAAARLEILPGIGHNDSEFAGGPTLMAALRSFLATSIAALAVAVGPVDAADAPPRLEPRLSPLATLHARLRQEEPMNNAYLQVAAAFPTSMRLPSGRQAEGPAAAFMAWQLVDSLIYAATDLDSLEASVAHLPRSLAGLDTGATFAAVLGELRRAWPAYLQDDWPAVEPGLRRQLQWWEEHLTPSLPQLLDHAAHALGLPPMAAPIPVILVAAMADKGAATFRSRGGPFIVVGTDRFSGSALAEVAVHEALHALDTATGPGAAALPSLLAAALRQQDVPAAWQRDLPHGLLFITAAAVVRRDLDAHHQPLGLSSGVYNRLPAEFVTAAAALIEQLLDRRIDASDVPPLLLAALPATAPPAQPVSPDAAADPPGPRGHL